MKKFCQIFLLLIISTYYEISFAEEKSIDAANKYFLQGEYYKAKKIYEELSSQGDVEALNILGCMYMLGKGVRENYSIGRELCGRACDQGSLAGCDNYNNDGKWLISKDILAKNDSGVLKYCTNEAKKVGNPFIDQEDLHNLFLKWK